MLKKRHIQKQESAATDTAPFSVGTLRRLLGYLAPYRGKVTVMYFFALLNVGATLAIPLIMKTVIDRYIAASDMRGLFLLSAVLAALVIVLYVSAYMQGRIMVDVGYRMLYDMRKDLFAHLQHMSFRYFDTHRAGETMSRLTNDVQVIEELLGAGLDTIVVDTLI
ncbi:MAG: ABC transporter transmembrane domain-containing protein, partial [Spirochaetota bacterium]